MQCLLVIIIGHGTDCWGYKDRKNVVLVLKEAKEEYYRISWKSQYISCGISLSEFLTYSEHIVLHGTLNAGHWNKKYLQGMSSLLLRKWIDIKILNRVWCHFAELNK